jgi:hypothetical protein
MLETAHVAAGAAIATKIPNPFIAIPLALASHFVLEKVPHWNPHLNTEKKRYGKITKKSTRIVIADASLALIVGSFIALRMLPDTGHTATILASCFIAALPDIVEGPYFFLNFQNKMLEKWVIFQKSIQVDTSIIPGLLTQITTLALSLWWVFS